jgi:hypothetical protein
MPIWIGRTRKRDINMNRWQMIIDPDDEYKKNVEIGIDKFKKGQISKNDFLDHYVNRHLPNKRMLFEEYEKLPLANHEQMMLEASKLEKSGLQNVKATIGPFRLCDKLPSYIREDDTGVGAIMIGYFNSNWPETRFQIDKIDVIFNEEHRFLENVLK